ncbi:MAG: hypothetical protein ACOYOU_11090 [Kiritimatiellia bacterium]
MSRRPNLVELPEHTQFEPLMADIQRYAVSDPNLPNREILLGQVGWQVSRFIQDLMHDASKTALLLETLRVLRAAAGPGKSTAEEKLLSHLQRVAWNCVQCLEAEGVTLASCRTTGLTSADPDLQPLCDVLALLVAFARECFEFNRPRDNFAGQRRALAFDILGEVGDILDLPDVVELARQIIKKGRADTVGALVFLEQYLGARQERPDDDLKTAILAYSIKANRRGAVVAALHVLVKTGTIHEMEACDRMDDWKTKHWGGG